MANQILERIARPATARGRARALAALLLAGASCGGRPTSPAPEEGSGIARPIDAYRQLGMLTGGADFPGVASFSMLAGPADSTYVVLGLSLPNTALRFQRDRDGFVGEYAVAVTFSRDTQVVKRVERREAVRIPTFSETGRTEESVVFQQIVALEPGRYTVEVRVRDGFSPRGFTAHDTLAVPAYGAHAARLAAAVVYQAEGRRSRDSIPELILNPRHVVPFGSAAPGVYLEGYGVPADTVLPVRVVDGSGRVVWAGSASLDAGGAALRHALVRVPPDSLPLGKLWVELGAAAGPPVPADADARGSAGREPLLVSVSEQWMVANFDDMLQFLRYIARPAELDSLRHASGAERRELWDDFWARRDPIPATPENEYRDAFFDRVKVATEQLAEPAVPGWRTDRGRVYIVLGPPDDVHRQEGSVPGGAAVIEWLYAGGAVGHVNLTFLDRDGFGRFRLEPASESAFRQAAARLTPKH